MMIAGLVIVLLGLGFGTLCFSFVTHAAVYVVRRKKSKVGSTFPISVLKPLKGADDALFENLSSLARQDYPSFELVLGCEDASDPALAVARRVAAAFPEVPMTIVAGGRPLGRNPKVNNLRHLSRAARFEHLLISDADVRVGPEYLRAIAAEMADPKVGLVSNPIAGAGERSFGSTLENLHLNTFVARSVCGADVLASHPCVIGKSMLFRRGDLERLGGWDVVKNVLAEDYVLGQAFRDAGHAVALSPYVITAMSSSRSFREFLSRHIRWSQMRRHLAGALYWGEPLMLPSAWFVAALVLLSAGGFGAHVARLIELGAIAGIAVQSVADAWLVKILRGEGIELKEWLLVPLRDVVMIGVWITGALRRTVNWRGNVFYIGPGSTLLPTEEPADAQAVEV